MGEYDDGRELGLWGDDGIPYWIDEVDNTAEIKKLKKELQILLKQHLKRTVNSPCYNFF